jgi:hypothetical protein
MLERFKEIFAGLDSAYGATTLNGKVKAGGKKETDNKVYKSPVTDNHWKRHLEGMDPALGVVPIRADNTCKWGCLDIDDYTFDHKKFSKVLKERNLPLIMFRSKSGGAHVFLFTKEFVPASLMRLKLKLIAASLGYSKVEIFPKQDSIKAERGETGSYLNVPYHGANETVRYAFDVNGNALSLEEFFELYEKKVMDLESLENFSVVHKEIDDFEGAPPCIQEICKNKVGEGMRNEMLYNIAVYLKKRFKDTWKVQLMKYNSKYMQNHEELLSEINGIIKGMENKEYKYKCDQFPICNFCDAPTCATKKFGVGDDVPRPEITDIRKFNSDPPLYFVNIGGKSVECDSLSLHDFDKLSVLSMDQNDMPLMPIGKQIWRKQLSKLFTKIETIEAPEATKLSVIMRDILTEYLNKGPAKDLKDLAARSRPYNNGEYSYFKWTHFLSYVRKTKVWPERKTKESTLKLMEEHFDMKEEFPKVEGKTIRVMKVPSMKLDKPKIRINEKKPSSFA